MPVVKFHKRDYTKLTTLLNIQVRLKIYIGSWIEKKTHVHIVFSEIELLDVRNCNIKNPERKRAKLTAFFKLT